jgi:hypothetical protein
VDLLDPTRPITAWSKKAQRRSSSDQSSTIDNCGAFSA